MVQGVRFLRGSCILLRLIEKGNIAINGGIRAWIAEEGFPEQGSGFERMVLIRTKGRFGLGRKETRSFGDGSIRGLRSTLRSTGSHPPHASRTSCDKNRLFLVGNGREGVFP